MYILNKKSIINYKMFNVIMINLIQNKVFTCVKCV